VFGNVKAKAQIYRDIMVSLDLNKNKKIDYTEFLTAASDKAKLLRKENLKFAF